MDWPPSDGSSNTGSKDGSKGGWAKMPDWLELLGGRAIRGSSSRRHGSQIQTGYPCSRECGNWRLLARVLAHEPTCIAAKRVGRGAPESKFLKTRPVIVNMFINTPDESIE